LAAENDTTVSAMFSRFIRGMAKAGSGDIPISSNVRKLSGVIRLPEDRSDREIVAEALMQKHGFDR
jgi:hypothetical protein